MWTDISENFDRVDHFPVKLSLLGCGVLYDLTESDSVQWVKFSWSFDLDGSSSGGIVHQGQLTESVTVLVSFQELIFTVDNLPTFILTWLDNEKSVTVFSFINDGFIFLCDFFLHGADEGFFVLVVNVLEKDGVANEASDKELGFGSFGDRFELDAFFFVEASEDFFWDSHSASSFTLEFLFGELGFVEGDFLDLIFAFWVVSFTFLLIFG